MAKHFLTMDSLKNNENIEEKYNFLKQKNTHKKAEEKIASDILNNVLYEHKKNRRISC